MLRLRRLLLPRRLLPKPRRLKRRRLPRSPLLRPPRTSSRPLRVRAWPAPLAACILASCHSGSPPAEPRDPDRIAIVAAESTPQGARLVALDEHGDRQFHLFETPDSVVRDTHPVISPDGSWLVFASSRDRTEGTSLWIARLGPDATATRLTTDAAIDSHPCWTRDGKAIVFASTRDGGDFDLFRLAIDGSGRAVGAPEQLTNGAGHEITPSVAADGSIVYGVVTPLADNQVESHLEERAPDGTIRTLTAGPADTSPALSPDDRALAFVRPKEHNGSLDGELFTMPRNSDVATPLIELPLTDETGPVWSPDGRFLFATSLLRGVAGNAVFSSVIVIDIQVRPMIARLLEDRTGAIARLTPAIAAARLDAAALASNPEYLPELARIVANAMASKNRSPSTP